MLVRLAREVTDREAAALGEVAATETLFAAVGRRILRGWRPTEEQTEPLQRLGQRQWALLSTLPPRATTPPSTGGSRGGGALKIADLAVDLPVMSLPMSPVGPGSDWHAPAPRGPRGFPLTPSERRAYLPFAELALELLSNLRCAEALRLDRSDLYLAGGTLQQEGVDG